MTVETIKNGRAPSAATRLCARQRELFERLRRLDGDAQLAGDPWVRGLADQQDDAVNDRLRAVTEWELDQIDSALVRIASGGYGVCASCGEVIDAVRLEVTPHVALCARCVGTVTS